LHVKSFYTDTRCTLKTREALENFRLSNPEQPETDILSKLLEIITPSEFDGNTYRGKP